MGDWRRILTQASILDAAKNIVPCINNLEVKSMEVPTVNVQRWSIVSQKPFGNVVAAVEAAIGRPNMSEFAKDIAAAATYPKRGGRTARRE